MPNDLNKIPAREKFGYGLGDCAANFVFQTQLIFLMSFYTDVLGIAASAVATMFLFSRLWDAVNDPLIGALADRTQTRWGKFRPWVLFTAIPFAVFFILAYTTPDLDARGKIVWAYITYNLLMMIYTANNIPYAALTNAMTSDPVERTSLMSWRFIMAMIAAFLVQTYTLKLVGYFGQGNDAKGYQLTMTMWACIASVFFVITFFSAKERVEAPPKEKTPIKKDLVDIFQTRSWQALALLTLFYFIYLSMRGGIGVYYFQYFAVYSEDLSYGYEDLFAWFNGAGLIASMIGILFSKPLVVQFGKLRVFQASVFLTALCTAAFYFIPPDAHNTMVAMQCLLQLIYGVSIPLLWAMIADVADLFELKNGRQAIAMTFAASVFALKMGLSLGGALTAWLLDYYGYQANAEQTDTAAHGIMLMMSVYPALAFIIGLVALLPYEINHEKELSLKEELAAQRAAI